MPPVVGHQHEVAVNDHAHRKSGADRERWLNVQVAAHDPLPDLVDALGSALLNGLDEGVPIIARARLGSDAEQGREQRRLKSAAQ